MKHLNFMCIFNVLYCLRHTNNQINSQTATVIAGKFMNNHSIIRASSVQINYNTIKHGGINLPHIFPLWIHRNQPGSCVRTQTWVWSQHPCPSTSEGPRHTGPLDTGEA